MRLVIELEVCDAIASVSRRVDSSKRRQIANALQVRRAEIQFDRDG